ncbi:MAG: TonB-dependent receptor [Spirobacillus cienkowskii]|uniref:TonB-dependent receptor n=1 Tax=Spirobacillus cienkowskii TaxID=495820 RepID=A0A369KR38_9BACT|nr:MAG: TonB-dependent receptor [Spirobacillus cienkowskii]
MFKNRLSTIICLFFVQIVFCFSHANACVKSQDLNKICIEGIVKQLGSKNPIADALIIDQSNRNSFIRTNKDGSFEFYIDKSSSGILIRADNFQDLTIEIKNGKLLSSSPFQLEPAPVYGGFGVIRAKQKNEISQNTFQQEEFTQTPGAGRDPVRVLQTLPSVLPANVGSADLVVRGGLPGDNSFFYDDLVFPFIFHFGGAETIIPPKMIEAMDFFPGSFSSRYADTIGGVIQLKSQNTTPERLSGEYDLGLVQTGIYMEGRLDAPKTDTTQTQAENVTQQNSNDNAIGYRLGFRRTYLELYKPLIQKIAGSSSFVTIPQATDYQLVLNGNHALGTWQGYLVGAADRASLSASLGDSTTADGKNKFSFYSYLQVSGVRYNLNLSNDVVVKFVFQQRYFLFQQDILGNTLDIKCHLFGIGLIVDKKIDEKLSFGVGVRPKYTYNTVGLNVVQFPSGDPTVFFDPELAPRVYQYLILSQLYGDLFFDVTYSPIKSLTVNPGVNVLIGTNSNQIGIDPRIGIRYELIEDHILKFAAGYYSQMPAVQYSSSSYGNPKLSLERSAQLVVGYEVSFLENFSADIQLWSKTSQSLVGMAVENPNNKFENSISSRAKGLEIFVKKKPSDFWFGWLSYGISTAEIKDPLTGIWRYSEYDRTHSLNIVYGQKITGNWKAGAKFQFLTGAPYTSINSGIFNQNTGKYTPQPDGNVYGINKNDARNPFIMQVDFRTEYDFLYPDWTLTTYLDILNVFNRKNVSFVTYNQDYSKKIEITSLPIIPTIGIIAKF